MEYSSLSDEIVLSIHTPYPTPLSLLGIQSNIYKITYAGFLMSYNRSKLISAIGRGYLIVLMLDH